MAKAPKIVVAGILDTKGDEIKFLADRVKAAGGEPVVLEITVGAETDWADLPLSTVLAEVGKKPEEIFALDRSHATDIVIEAGKKLVQKMLDQGEIDGMVAYGGSTGASIATALMQLLPVGMPKLMLTTMASGDIRAYIGTKDIHMAYPIAEAGLNKVTRQVLNNSAASVVAMATAPSLDDVEEKPLIGCMMFGVTTPCVLKASQYFEDTGKYDVIINHAVGTGGRSMEELIRDGHISGIMDITTHEIGDYLLGGVLSAGPDRLTAAGDRGIPQVVAPGGLDLINFGPKETVPQEFLDQTHLPGKGLYVHNPTVTCVGVSPDEAGQVAQHIAPKLNRAQGPTVFFVPMKGWGACDLPEPDQDLGWPGPGGGPVWVADEERPDWSLRSRAFVRALRDNVDRNRESLEVVAVDMHLNEPAFAELVANTLEEMLEDRWEKGKYPDWARLVPVDKL